MCGRIRATVLPMRHEMRHDALGNMPNTIGHASKASRNVLEVTRDAHQVVRMNSERFAQVRTLQIFARDSW